ncbi:adhesin P1 [Mycoplasmoides genitalium]
MHQPKKRLAKKSWAFLTAALTLGVITGVGGYFLFNQNKQRSSVSNFAYQPKQLSVKHQQAVDETLTPWTWNNNNFSSLKITGENPGSFGLVRSQNENLNIASVTKNGSDDNLKYLNAVEKYLDGQQNFAIRRYDNNGRALYDINLAKMENPSTVQRGLNGEPIFDPFKGFGLTGNAPTDWNEIKGKVPVEVVQSPHSPNLYFVLLVPKVVVEYHNLNNQVVKESLEVEATDSFDPTQRLKSDSPMKDSNKDSEKLEESSMSGATSTRKALKIEVERGSSDTLSKSDFAKKPLKHKDNSGEVKLEAEKDFPQGKVWKPLLTTDQIKDNRGMGATVVSVYDAPYSENHTAFGLVDHIDPKKMVENYPPSWKTPKWNHHGIWDYNARNLLLQTTGFFNPRRHPEWFDEGQAKADNTSPGFKVGESDHKKDGFKDSSSSSSPIALPFEAYFANIGNMVAIGNSVFIFGGNGHATKMFTTNPLSIGVFRIKYTDNFSKSSVTGWPYAVLFGGLINPQTNGLKDLPLGTNRWFEYVPRMAVSGVKWVGNQLVLAGTLTMGDTATVPRLKYDQLEKHLNLVAQGQGLLREDLQIFTPYGWANRPDIPAGAWLQDEMGSKFGPHYFLNNPDIQDNVNNDTVEALINTYYTNTDKLKHVYPYRYSGLYAWQLFNWSNKLTNTSLSANFVNENSYAPNSLFAAILNEDLLTGLSDKIGYGKENEFADNEADRFNQLLSLNPSPNTNWARYLNVVQRFTTGPNLDGSTFDQFLDFLPWIGNGKPFSNSHTFSASSTSSTPLPTFSNINVGVKSMITQHLNKENTRWVFIPNSSPDIWTGAGYRKANNNNNGIPLTSVLPSSSSSTPFNPDSDDNKVTSGSSSKPTTYPALPNSISPTSDWINALTFTNKNNPQRNQLLLRALLGTIPVLINKSGGSGNEFNHTSEQKWDKTETNEGNLPGFGEVNGLYNAALLHTYGFFGTNTNSTDPKIGFKADSSSSSSSSSSSTLVGSGLNWTSQDVGNLVVINDTSFGFQLGGWFITFTDFIRPRTGYLGITLSSLQDQTIIWADQPWTSFKGSYLDSDGTPKSLWDPTALKSLSTTSNDNFPTLSPSFQLYQPNKVKTNAYQNSGTYNKLIEPEQWNQASDLTNMTNLLKLLSSKNIKQKLGKDTQSMGNNGGGVSQTINTITTTGNISEGLKEETSIQAETLKKFFDSKQNNKSEIGIGDSTFTKMDGKLTGVVSTPLVNLINGQGATSDSDTEKISFKPGNQIDFNRLFTLPVTELFDPNTMLVYDQYVPLLVNLPSGFDQASIRLKVISYSVENQTLGVRLEFKDPDTNQFIPVLNASSTGPQTVFQPFNQWADYVLPLIVTVPIVVIILSVTLGLTIGIPMHRNKKALQAGFDLSNKKVDVLTKAVGSVFKEIINRTGISNAPKKLKQATPTKPTPKTPPKPPVKQ